jgi:hypothetical protein
MILKSFGTRPKKRRIRSDFSNAFLLGVNLAPVLCRDPKPTQPRSSSRDNAGSSGDGSVTVDGETVAIKIGDAIEQELHGRYRSTGTDGGRQQPFRPAATPVQNSRIVTGRPKVAERMFMEMAWFLGRKVSDIAM